MVDYPKIFIGSSGESLELALAIKSNFAHDKVVVRIWNENIFPSGTYPLETLIEVAKHFDYAIFVWAGDDQIISRGIQSNQPRDNVIFEAGMFYSILGRSRVFLFTPFGNSVKAPSDLLGLIIERYKADDDNYVSAMSVAVSRVRKIIFQQGLLHSSIISHVQEPPVKIFKNINEARHEIQKECLTSREIKILTNKGLELFGLDSSIISLSDKDKYTSLRRLKILLLDKDSVKREFIALRAYEKLEDFIKELETAQTIVELGYQRFVKGRERDIQNSGIKYHKSEPYYRFVMTANKVFVSSYAEETEAQVKDLPVYVFSKDFGSIYWSLKRHFNDLWKNNSTPGNYLRNIVDVEVAAGGIVFYDDGLDIFIALVQRDDGSWVLPKGHRLNSDENLSDTAIREVCEETGLKAEDLICLYKIDTYAYDETNEQRNSKKVNHFFFMCCERQTQPVLQADPDHKSAKWWNVKIEFPFMFYIYQQILLSEVVKKEFGIDIKINPKR